MSLNAAQASQMQSSKPIKLALVKFVTTSDPQSFAVVKCCVILYTLFGLMCANRDIVVFTLPE